MNHSIVKKILAIVVVVLFQSSVSFARLPESRLRSLLREFVSCPIEGVNEFIAANKNDIGSCIDFFYGTFSGNNLAYTTLIAGDYNRFFALLESKHVQMNPYMRNSVGSTCLHIIASRPGLVIQEGRDASGNVVEKDIEIVRGGKRISPIKYLVQRYPRLSDARDSSGKTPLHCAAESGNLRAVMMLITTGSSVHVFDDEGNTPLHLAVNREGLSAAAEANALRVAKILLRYGSLSFKNNAGIDALQLAKLKLGKASYDEFLGLVRLRSASTKSAVLDQSNNYNELHRAAQRLDYPEVLRLLVQGNVSVHAIDTYGNTALHYLCLQEGREFSTKDKGPEKDREIKGKKEAFIKIARLLIMFGAQFKQQNNGGEIAYMIAADRAEITDSDGLIASNVRYRDLLDQLVKLALRPLHTGSLASNRFASFYGVHGIPQGTHLKPSRDQSPLFNEFIRIVEMGGTQAETEKGLMALCAAPSLDDLAFRDEHGNNFLFYALANRLFNVSNFIIDRFVAADLGGAICGVANLYGFTPLHVVAHTGLPNDIEGLSGRALDDAYDRLDELVFGIVSKIIKNLGFYSINSRDISGRTALMHAVDKNNFILAGHILFSDNSVTVRGSQRAARAAEEVPERVAVDCYYDLPYTPLYRASKINYVGIVESLLRAGARVDLILYGGVTLEQFLAEKSSEIRRLLSPRRSERLLTIIEEDDAKEEDGHHTVSRGSRSTRSAGSSVTASPVSGGKVMVVPVSSSALDGSDDSGVVLFDTMPQQPKLGDGSPIRPLKPSPREKTSPRKHRDRSTHGKRHAHSSRGKKEDRSHRSNRHGESRRPSERAHRSSREAGASGGGSGGGSILPVLGKSSGEQPREKHDSRRRPHSKKSRRPSERARRSPRGSGASGGESGGASFLPVVGKTSGEKSKERRKTNETRRPGTVGALPSTVSLPAIIQGR